MKNSNEQQSICLFEQSIDSILEFSHSSGVGGPEDDFGEFEKGLHARVMAFERDILQAKIQSVDVNAPSVEINGVRHRRVLNSSTTITTAAGDVKVTHTLYRDRSDPDSRSESALKRKLGIIHGFTPHAAALGEFLVTELVPDKAAETLRRIGNMTPSKSTLGRLPKSISTTWEENRPEFEAALREGVVIPDGTVTLAVSLDGVMAPMDDANRAEKRRKTADEGRLTRGPAGYREVGCGTLSFCDDTGEMISAIRIARSPESKKKSLKAMLLDEVKIVLEKSPTLTVVKLADGAKDNWTFLSNELPDGFDILDLYHASTHLNEAVAAAYGDGTTEARRRYEDLRHVMRHQEGGTKSVIRSLAYLAKKHPTEKRIKEVVNYFRRNKKRMQYAEFSKANLPIGSGVVEAACKTLVTQRLKRSGMVWSHKGAQAILTPRAWTQSQRFDDAWALLAAAYKADVVLINDVTGEFQTEDVHPVRDDNVIPFPGKFKSSR